MASVLWMPLLVQNDDPQNSTIPCWIL